MNAFPDNSLPNCPNTQSQLFRNQGWAGLKNGKLLEKISGKYQILLTIDSRFGNEQEIPGDVAVVTIRARSNRIQDLKPLVPKILQVLKQAKAGKVTSVGRITRR
jgi:hypothetical protein